jgi:hypothetical protein
VQAAPIVPGATVEGTRYTAGSIAGADRVSLFSPSTGASGFGEIYVISRPTSISIRRMGANATIQSVRLGPGETLELDVLATYYRRDVIAQAHSFTFAVSGDIGEMVEPGVFKAAEATGLSGTITVTAGGREAVLRVDISGFVDMVNHWGKEYAEFLAARGITIGVTPTEYGPNVNMRRGDYILMLYRAAGEPEVSDLTCFDDVPFDAYYARALAWAMDKGIAFGDDGNNFHPRDPVSRQDAFTFTYRALELLGIQYDAGTDEDLEGFPDADMVADYAVIATATLVRLGIVEGSNGLLIPENTLTRAQMAKVLATVLQLP